MLESTDRLFPRPRPRTLLAGALLAAALLTCETKRPDHSSGVNLVGTQDSASLAPALSALRPAAPRPPDIPAPPDVAAPPPDAQKTASGLVSKVLRAGTGKVHPDAKDNVRVHYTGWTKDGRMFDSSVARGEPAEFAVGGVIAGWTEALQLMVAGEKRRLWIPARLAYGEHPRTGAPAGDLCFDVELLEIVAAPQPPPVPPDVATPPLDARRTASGLAYKLLQKGGGDRRPTAADRVRVHYTGWTRDGKMFDSSVTRGRPATFALGGVIRGWTEGLQLMSVGDKMRFWIPADLAYGQKPKRAGAPAGDLCFDVELLDVL
ncbi:MAG: FKBP-type peptidyl-prolyl cis-trans isomerase [Deltaproteobacteria bacterium]|nr:FKBP-type peptidyl-prolyl cis-trans isomerase [Deltaproteobacteria bacterium]